MSAATPFAAVLLAGGRSQRMGRDKALLPLPGGQLLWQRQLAVLNALQPAELFISGPGREGFPASATRLADETPGLGPLAGIVTTLRAMRSPRLLVLAIDLPLMTSDFLRGLLTDDLTSSSARGIIPQTGDGFFEPLAAVYPRTALATAEEHLRSADRSLQTLSRQLVRNGAASARPILDSESSLFANWNRLEDTASRPPH